MAVGMGLMAFGNCNASCQCKIATDDFNRANSDSLGASWVEESGDGDIDGNELLWATTGIAIHQTSHPGGADAPSRVKVRFKRSATTEYARGILAWTDSSNYLYASVETVAGCDQLRLFAVVAGATTEIQDAQTIGDGAPLNVRHTLEACLEPGVAASSPQIGDIFRAKVTLDGGKIYGSQADSDNYVGGLKAGVAGSAGLRMDDFYFGWMKDEEEPCKDVCPDCTTPCLIESDSFPGGSETACKWNGSTMRVFHPELGTEHHVTATIDLQDGENAELRLNSNGTDYHWAKVSLSGTTLTVSVGKTGTTLASETATFNGGSLSLCADFELDVIQGGANGLLILVAESETVADGIYAGRSGSAEWSSFTFEKLEPPCESTCSGGGLGGELCPEMDACIDRLFPKYIIVDIPTQNDPDSNCTGCEGAFSGMLMENDTASAPSASGCVVDPSCGGYAKRVDVDCPPFTRQEDFIVAVSFSFANDETTVTVIIHQFSNPFGAGPCSQDLQVATYQLTVDGPIDCLSLDLSLPLVDFYDAQEFACDFAVSGPARVRAV